MTRSRHVIWEKEEYLYQRAGAFIPNIVAVLHDDEQVHPAMIIAPGGAYVLLSCGEADFAARKFFEKGYNTFVLSYTNNVTLDTPVNLQPLKDISRAVQYIRKNKEQFNINPGRVFACGYSAGGHLVGSLATRHDMPELHGNDEYTGTSNRLDAAILNYPAVSSSMESLRYLFSSLLFDDAAKVDDLSLELHVSINSSPMFLLHGMSDSVASVQHTILLAAACAEKGIDCEVHLFQNGEHGVTNSDSTPEDAAASVYVFDQLYETVKAMPEDEFIKYASLYGSLRKDMSYDEFMNTVAKETMIRIFMTALRVDPAKMGEVIAAAQREKNPNADYWRDMADNWLKLVAKG